MYYMLQSELHQGNRSYGLWTKDFNVIHYKYVGLTKPTISYTIKLIMLTKILVNFVMPII